MKSFLFRSTILWTALVLLTSFAAPRDADAAEKINASYGAISGSMAPIWVAKEARLFDKQGLDLNLVYIPGGPRSIMSLIGNSIQFVNHSGMPALEAYQRGADTVMIASSMNQLEHAVMADKSITSVDQLKGKAPDAQAPLGGVMQARIVVDGTGDSVHRVMSDANGMFTVILPNGEVRAAFAELTGINVSKGLGLLLTNANDKAEIRCGVAQFNIKDGLMSAQNITVDTQNVLIKGQGDIELGPEELNLRIKGDPKKVFGRPLASRLPDADAWLAHHGASVGPHGPREFGVYPLSLVGGATDLLAGEWGVHVREKVLEHLVRQL